jgi:membrane-anchored protein YejM (alkaline phosphatase superfamily)
MLTFLGQCIHAWGYAHNAKKILTLSHAIPVYYPLIANKEVKSWGLFRPDLVEKNDGIKVGQTSGFNYPREPFQCTPERPPNIVFITLESWRFDRLTPDVTPHIYNIGEESLVFGNHISTGTVTDRGLFGLFYGVSPAYIESALGAGSKPAIIEAVQQLNYEQWIIANQNIRSNKLDVLLFPDIKPIQQSGRGKVYEGDVGVVDQFIERLNENNDKPFFSFLLFNSSHFSYWTPPNYPKPFEPSARFSPSKAKEDTEPLPYFNQYSNSLHFLDEQVERVRQALLAENKWDNTIVVITGDHGEEFKDQETAYWGHGSNFSRYQIGVPMVIHWPGRQRQKFNYRTSHEDLTPTLLVNALSCSNAISDVSTGKSLFDDSPRVNIVESYVNQAIIAEDVVTELFPGFVKTYEIEDVSVKTKTPAAAIKGVQETLSHFR